ncbi:hypothetical protein HT031_006512 [Scenedesmus sp. PABB004]|nr:hypothetical protein HT031_006512 [Scenedesmus sp. PABB004]
MASTPRRRRPPMGVLLAAAIIALALLASGASARGALPMRAPCAPGTSLDRAAVACVRCAAPFYCPGGSAAPRRCSRTLPKEIVATLRPGAASAADCRAAPGWQLMPGGDPERPVQCPIGSYKVGWNNLACKSCGPNFLTDGEGTTRPRGECYFPAGSGSVLLNGTVSVVPCRGGTYGRVAKTYFHHRVIDCKRCGPNLVTADQAPNAVLEMLAPNAGPKFCLAAPGHHIVTRKASAVAEPCPKGTWSSGFNTARQCQPCTRNTTTKGVAAVSENECTDSTSSGLPPGFETPVGGENLSPCSKGTWSAGGLAGNCTACPAGSTTPAPQAGSLSDCSLCLAGFGSLVAGAGCTQCAPNTYTDSEQTGPCLPCPAGFVSAAGSTARAQCVKQVQTTPGTIKSNIPSTPVEDATTGAACAAACADNAKCILFTFAAGKCELLLETAPASSPTKLFVPSREAPAGRRTSLRRMLAVRPAAPAFVKLAGALFNLEADQVLGEPIVLAQPLAGVAFDACAAACDARASTPCIAVIATRVSGAADADVGQGTFDCRLMKPSAAAGASDQQLGFVFDATHLYVTVKESAGLCDAGGTNCAVDCAGVWEVGECSAACDGGERRLTFQITRPAANGGALCTDAAGSALLHGQTTTIACNEQPCAVDCAGEWRVAPDAWCSATCGDGTVRQTYVVTQQPKFGGKECPNAEGATRDQPCNLGACSTFWQPVRCPSAIGLPAGSAASWPAACPSLDAFQTCSGACSGSATGAPPVATCGGDGVWSVTTPANCQLPAAVTCSVITPATADPSAGGHAAWAAGCGSAVGDTCAASCAEGYTGAPGSATCGGNGAWTVTTASCQPDEAPTINALAPASATVTQGAGTHTLTTASATDPNAASGDTITFSLGPGLTGDVHGVAVAQVGGSVSFNASATDLAVGQTYTFAVVATDLAGLSSSTDFNLTVSAGPSLAFDPLLPGVATLGTGVQVVALAVVSGSSHTGGFSYKLPAEHPTWLSVDRNQVKCNTTAAARGNYTVDVRVTDPDGVSSTAVLDLRVNTAPTLALSSGAATITELSGSHDLATLTAADDDGDTLTLSASVTGQEGHGVSVAGTKLVFDSDASALPPGASYNVLVTATDPDGAQATEPFALTVNGRPTLTLTPTLAEVSLRSGSALVVATALVSDVEPGQAHTFTLDPGNLPVEVASRLQNVSDHPDQNAVVLDTGAQSLVAGQSYTFRVTVTDAAGASDTQSATIAVVQHTNTNNLVPSVTLSASSISVSEDSGPYQAQGFATIVVRDPEEQLDNDTVTVSCSSDLFSAAPTLTRQGASTIFDLAFTPAPDANGNSVCSVRAADTGPAPATGEATFTIAIAAVNDAPSLAVTTIWLTPTQRTGQQLIATATAADIDRQALSFSLHTDLLGTSILSNDAGLQEIWLDTDNAGLAPGSYSLVVLVSDGEATISSQLTVAVQPGANRAPTFTVAQPSVTRGEDAGAVEITGFLTGVGDPDPGQVLTASVVCTINGGGTSNPLQFAASPAVALLGGSGTLRFTAAADAFGHADCTVKVEDDAVGTTGQPITTSAPFSIVITSVNDAPSFGLADTDISRSANVNKKTYSVDGWATDISQGAPNESTKDLQFVVTGNTNPTLVTAVGMAATGGTAGKLTFTVAARKSGSATITLELCDGDALCSSTKSFTISVA